MCHFLKGSTYNGPKIVRKQETTQAGFKHVLTQQTMFLFLWDSPRQLTAKLRLQQILPLAQESISWSDVGRVWKGGVVQLEIVHLRCLFLARAVSKTNKNLFLIHSAYNNPAHVEPRLFQ